MVQETMHPNSLGSAPKMLGCIVKHLVTVVASVLSSRLKEFKLTA